MWERCLHKQQILVYKASNFLNIHFTLEVNSPPLLSHRTFDPTTPKFYILNPEILTEIHLAKSRISPIKSVQLRNQA